MNDTSNTIDEPRVLTVPRVSAFQAVISGAMTPATSLSHALRAGVAAPRVVQGKFHKELAGRSAVHDNANAVRGSGIVQIRDKAFHELASRPLPDGIDWSVFSGLDFDRLAAGRPTRGRRPKSQR